MKKVIGTPVYYSTVQQWGGVGEQSKVLLPIPFTYLLVGACSCLVAFSL